MIQKYAPLELLTHLDEVPAEKKQGVINNLGGHINHSFFWEIIAPKPYSFGSIKLAPQIDTTFGGFDSFKEQFTQKALTVF